MRRPGLQSPAPTSEAPGLPASSKLTMYGFGVARFPCQLCQCRTSGVHCSLSSKARCYFMSTQMAFPKTRPFPSPNSRKMCMARVVLTPSQGQRKNAPMSSANPPTGRRQVPVTNCNSRILFSLSISFTTCNSRRHQGCRKPSTSGLSRDISRSGGATPGRGDRQQSGTVKDAFSKGVCRMSHKGP